MNSYSNVVFSTSSTVIAFINKLLNCLFSVDLDEPEQTARRYSHTCQLSWACVNGIYVALNNNLVIWLRFLGKLPVLPALFKLTPTHRLQYYTRVFDMNRPGTFTWLVLVLNNMNETILIVHHSHITLYAPLHCPNVHVQVGISLRCMFRSAYWSTQTYHTRPKLIKTSLSII